MTQRDEVTRLLGIDGAFGALGIGPAMLWDPAASWTTGVLVTEVRARDAGHGFVEVNLVQLTAPAPVLRHWLAAFWGLNRRIPVALGFVAKDPAQPGRCRCGLAGLAAHGVIAGAPGDASFGVAENFVLSVQASSLRDTPYPQVPPAKE